MNGLLTPQQLAQIRNYLYATGSIPKGGGGGSAFVGRGGVCTFPARIVFDARGRIIDCESGEENANGNAYPPSGSNDLAAPVSTTSAALEDMVGHDTTVTLDTPGRIAAVMSVEADSTGGGSNATGAWAIEINGVDYGEIGRFLSGTNDLGALCVAARSALLAAATYTVQGRHRRRSGDKTVTSEASTLVAFAVA